MQAVLIGIAVNLCVDQLQLASVYRQYLDLVRRISTVFTVIHPNFTGAT
jgi:hypothetical protein